MGSLATATLMMPKFLKAFERNGGVTVPSGNKVIVVLQMSGGNDGLNTVIPISNDIYHRSRPGLGIAKDKALMLTDDAALHPELTAFKTLYDDGSLGILNSVGYPDPDRSHFRSMDIWQTGSASTEFITTGWIGRYLDAQCSGCGKPTQALEIDDILSLALKGSREKGIAFKDPRRLYNTSNENYFKQLAAQHHAEEHEKPVDYLYKTMAETLSSADYIFEQSKLRPSSASYPQTELGNNLRTIASLILSDINTKIYYVSIGSFDTHEFQ
ncbi:MAG TPA: hypothetical protein VHB70_03515, partial [Parafilimonas sp.]|nr:hypothetical protein [Parafilimonas sp.]